MTVQPDSERERRFLQLLRPVHSRAERFAMSITQSRDDARDLMQDALVVMWQHFDDLREQGAFRTYLFTVISNLNKKRFRKYHRETAFAEGAEDEILGSEMPLDQRADATIVREAIDALPEKAREAVILYEVHDLPVAEIAQIQQCTVSAVKVRLMRARRTLAKKLGVTDDTEFSPTQLSTTT